jgi:polysaccharide deacetylase family protein (PEP-CTERM system associated)
MAGCSIPNVMSVDVEDYFQVSALAPYIPRESWDGIPRRIERNIGRILELFDHHRIKATFFTLGWIAERHPGVVRSIVDNGHELASHGYAHRRASEQTPGEYREDVGRARKLLEDIGGVEVKGYRAPSFSIGNANRWALDVLREAGYRYSSSVYPVRHDHYGMPEAPRFAHQPLEGLIELPPTTVRLLGKQLPAAGGGWFRMLPYALSRALIRRVHEQDGQSCMFYFHPWEIDPEQPVQPGVDVKTRFRHYVNLSRMEGKLDRLLSDFAWHRADVVFREHLSCARVQDRPFDQAQDRP